jgi:hypothetical protein
VFFDSLPPFALTRDVDDVRGFFNEDDGVAHATLLSRNDEQSQ